VFKNKTGKLKKSNNKIWTELEKVLKGKITALTIYLNFLKNRGNLLNILKEKTGLSQAEFSIQNENVRHTYKVTCYMYVKMKIIFNHLIQLIFFSRSQSC